ncbi:uncharacterized protein LOC141902047 [Tubulanus polymorphus]|uniref:uncharacterized protein LOC141902047 n=1 Tax=Tubulanus polymorphus TaxID=672921 RepID=UPI003DA3E74C
MERELNKSSLMLDLSRQKYRDWYEVIQHDDIDTFEKTLSALNEKEKRRRISGKFLYVDSVLDDCPHLKSEIKYDFEFPLVLAASFGAGRCVRAMIEDGVDVTVQDKIGCNCFHAIVVVVAHDRGLEEKYMDIYSDIVSLLGQVDRRALLMQENSEGFTPLELAAKEGTYGLFRLILDTPGVYMEIVAERGVHTVLRYDLSMYEDGRLNRRNMHCPLRMLVFLKREGLASFLNNNIHQMPIIHEWTNYRIRKSIPYIVLILIARVLYVIFAYIWSYPLFCGASHNIINNPKNMSIQQFEIDGKDRLKCTGTVVLTTITIITSILYILEAVFQIGWYLMKSYSRQMLSNMLKEWSYVAYTSFYQSCQFLLSILVLSSCVVTLVKQNLTYANYFHALYFPMLLIMLLSVLELLPKIGSFAITLQNMICLFINFIIATSLIKVMFAMFFQHIYWRTDSFPNSVFKILLLESGATQFNVANAPVYVQISYIVFYYLAAVMLMNYLIAVMTSEATDGQDVKTLVQNLRRLGCAYHAQECIGHTIEKIFEIKPKKRFSITVVDTGNKTTYYERLRYVEYDVKENGDEPYTAV